MWGGGVGCFDSSPTIINCIFRNNESEYWWGGGIVSYGCTLTITNCLFAGNSASRQGGAIYLNQSLAKITNCTMVQNDAPDGGGGIYAGYSSEAILINSILWEDSPDEIFVFVSELSANHCAVKGGAPGKGNIELNPAFADPTNGDYRLKNFSPCIGAGTPQGIPDTDIEGDPRPSPPNSHPDMGCYENTQGIRAVPPLNIFGIEVGNEWSYEGTEDGTACKVERKIISIDRETFPPDTYIFEITENGSYQPGEWFERSTDELRLWGAGYKFSKGLLAAWYPMNPRDHKVSSADIVGYPGYKVSLTVDVMGKVPAALPFLTLEAYELAYQLRIWGLTLDKTDTFRWWVVPYLGVVKHEDAQYSVELTSFSIGCGTISGDSDMDGDGLKDWEELILYGTNWQVSDKLKAMPWIPLLLLND
jgi:predicted outer membrane repeat protein